MIRRTSHFIERLFRDCRGQDFVEYSLLAGFIAVASTAAISPIAEPIGEIISKAQSLTTQAAGDDRPDRDKPFREPNDPTS